MAEIKPGSGPDMGEFADALWRRLRAMADDELAHQQETRTGCCVTEVRGAMYLFAVDLVARLVDRLEQESDPSRRAVLAQALLAGEAPLRRAG